MKGFDVLRVKSAVKNHNKFDLSRSHLTTMDFGQIVPLFAEETVPGDKYSINAEFFSRMAPLVKPTYGKFSFKTVNAFVPYHQIAVDAEAWLSGKTTWEGQTPTHRWFSMGTLADYVFQNCVDTSATVTDDNKEFQYIDGNGSLVKICFTPAGRFHLKVLNALGYTIPQGVDLRSSSNWVTATSKIKLSAYPLIAFFKLYNDYMSQSQRFNTSVLSALLNAIKYRGTALGYVSSTGEIQRLAIANMFSYLLLAYENDYFVSAWQSANNPLASVESVSSLIVPQSGTAYQVSQTVQHNSVNIAAGNLSQRALDFLRSYDNWVRRNNYSGSRSVQQVYSRFGIKTDEYRSHYAHIISTDSVPLQIGDVTASAGTNVTLGGVSQDIPLGDYAGKGIMSGSKGFSINVDDYGMIFVLGYFTVAPMYAFGYDRKVLRNSPLDYYNPEFDGLGADAISLGEVWASPIASPTDTTKDSDVFGYTERYNSYRFGRDMITGDFRNYHKDGDMNVWHSGRNLQTIRENGTLVAQSSAMNTLPQTDSEYNRIFSYTGDDFDHFYLTARFNVSAVRPMLNLNQVVNLGEGDTAVPRNGNVIS